MQTMSILELVLMILGIIIIFGLVILVGTTLKGE